MSKRGFDLGTNTLSTPLTASGAVSHGNEAEEDRRVSGGGFWGFRCMDSTELSVDGGDDASDISDIYSNSDDEDLDDVR